MKNKKYYTENGLEIYIFNTKFILMIAKSLNDQAKNTLKTYIEYKNTFKSYKKATKQIKKVDPGRSRLIAD